VDPKAKRRWSDSYLVLTSATLRRERIENGAWFGTPTARLVSWIGSQSVPSPLPANFAGWTRSELISILEAGHKDVKLSSAEFETIACWIDLLVPYCGDYMEANAWTRAEVERYQHFLDKRRRMEEIERRNVQEFLGKRATPLFGDSKPNNK
jgi:hypothetical protein